MSNSPTAMSLNHHHGYAGSTYIGLPGCDAFFGMFGAAE
jgi:hypothetical protein